MRFLFDMVDRFVGRWLSAAMSVLFVTGVFAGLPASVPAAASLGALRAWCIRRTDPGRYRGIGFGLSEASN